MPKYKMALVDTVMESRVTHVEVEAESLDAAEALVIDNAYNNKYDNERWKTYPSGEGGYSVEDVEEMVS